MGEGSMGKTFRVSLPEGDFVEKNFDPKCSASLVYRLLFLTSHHPYSPNNPLFPLALEAAAQRRHLASLLSETGPQGISILDAELTPNGLRMPYIEGHHLTHKDKEILPELDRLAKYLEDMGLSSWNLKGVLRWTGWGMLKIIRNGFGNILVADKKATVVDWEEAFPVPDRQWGGWRFDDIDWPTFKKELNDRRPEIVAKIGPEQYEKLLRFAKLENFFWGSFRSWENSATYNVQTLLRSLKPAYLSETVDSLVERRDINPEESETLKQNLTQLSGVKSRWEKVFPHLVAHNLTRLLPHGVASLARLGYTLAGKAVENLLGKEPKKHTWLVAFFSLIPTLGGFAYFINLIPKNDPIMTRLALESIAHHCFHTNLDRLLENWGKRESSRKIITRFEKIIRTTVADQFSHEIMVMVMDPLVAAAKSKRRLDDEWPTQIYLGGKVYLVNWGYTRVLEVDAESRSIIKLPRKKTQEIINVLRQESYLLGQDLKKVLL